MVNKEDIIRMAEHAGFADGIAEIMGLEGFYNFAALAAAAEREACAKMFDGEVWAYDYREIAAAIRARGEQEQPR